MEISQTGSVVRGYLAEPAQPELVGLSRQRLQQEEQQRAVRRQEELSRQQATQPVSGALGRTIDVFA